MLDYSPSGLQQEMREREGESRSSHSSFSVTEPLQSDTVGRRSNLEKIGDAAEEERQAGEMKETVSSNHILICKLCPDQFPNERIGVPHCQEINETTPPLLQTTRHDDVQVIHSDENHQRNRNFFFYQFYVAS